MKEIAEMLHLRHSTVHGIAMKYRETGVIEATKRTTPNTKKLSQREIASIREWIDEDCSQSLKELVAKLREHHQVVVSTTTVARAIKGFHYSFKRVHKVAERAVLPGLK